MGWNPWDVVDELPVEVVECPCPVSGLYFPHEQVIVLARGLTSAVAASALAEEIGHFTLSHEPTADRVGVARMELAAQRWAAVRLVSLEDLADALVAAVDLSEVAEELGVDVATVKRRLVDLTASERLELRRMVGRKELNL